MAQLKDLIVNGPSRFVGDVMLNTAVGTLSGSNASVSPDHALLISGYNRADDSSGDTWIYGDALGGAPAPWGIKHNQTDNYIEFYGAGAPKSFINLSTGDHYAKGFVNTDYWSAEYALTSNGGVAHIPSMSVNYANTAGSAPASDVYAWAKASSKPSYNFGEIGAGTAIIGDGANRLMFRINESYLSGIYYSTPGNEALVFANGNAVTSGIFATANPNSQGSWYDLTPSLQIKNQCVVINKLIPNDTYASYNLDVNGSFNATSGYINGSAIATKSEIPTSLPANGGTADYANSATYDSNWNHIANTYATQSWVSSNFNYSTDTWRPITDSYSGSDQGTSLSQYGANALYNALVNGYAAEAGYASSAGSANSVAGSNVSGRPTSVSQFTNDSGYVTQSWVTNQSYLSANVSSGGLSSSYANITTYAQPVEGASYDGMVMPVGKTTDNKLAVTAPHVLTGETILLDTYSTTELSSSTLIVDLYPGRTYDFTQHSSLSRLTIQSIGHYTGSCVSHTFVRFYSASDSFTLTLPSNIKGANGNAPEIKGQCYYEISFTIRENSPILATGMAFE